MKTTSSKLQRKVVGAPGFEPGASCAQGRRKAPDKPPRINLNLKNIVVRSISGLCLDVCGCDSLLVGSLQKSLHALRGGESLTSARNRHSFRPPIGAVA